MEDRLINLFYEYLKGWSWEEWQAAGSSDKEEVVINALADLGLEMDVEEAYDLFYDWAAGLTEADFGGLTEANKIVRRFANNGWYSGYARGLNDIASTTPLSDEEAAAKRAKAEEEKRKAEEEAKRQEAVAKAQKAIDSGEIDEYNYYNKRQILYSIPNKMPLPAIDPETKELVWGDDPVRQEKIVEASAAAVHAYYQRQYEKAMETRERNKKAAQEKKAVTYKWTASWVLTGKQWQESSNVIGNTDPESTAEALRLKAIDKIKEEMRICKVVGEPFDWDGRLTISCTAPDGKEEIIKKLKFKGIKFNIA